MSGKKSSIRSSSSEARRIEQKCAGETDEVQQAPLRANRKRNAAARQLEIADIQQAHLLANSNRNAAAREQNTQERQYIMRNADQTYHWMQELQKIFIGLWKLFLTISKKITKMILK